MSFPGFTGILDRAHETPPVPAAPPTRGRRADAADLVLDVLAAVDPPAPSVPTDAVAEVIRGAFTDAQDVLRRLVATGHARRVGPDDIAVTATPDTTAVDHRRPELARYARWYLLRAAAAHRAVRPHVPLRAQPPDNRSHDGRFSSPGEAVAWFRAHTDHLHSLLPTLARADNRATPALGEVLWHLDRWTGDHRRAVHAQLVALTATDRAPAPDPATRWSIRSRHLAMLALAYAGTGHRVAASQACEDAIEHADRSGDHGARSAAHSARGRILLHAGRSATALEDLLLAVALAREPHDRATAHLRVGIALGRLHRAEKALDHLDTAETALTGLGDQVGHARVRTARAAILHRIHRHHDALTLLTRALDVLTHSGSPHHQGEARELQGRCHAALGDHRRARHRLLDAEQAFTAAGRRDRATATHALATLLQP